MKNSQYSSKNGFSLLAVLLAIFAAGVLIYAWNYVVDSSGEISSKSDINENFASDFKDTEFANGITLKKEFFIKASEENESQSNEETAVEQQDKITPDTIISDYLVYSNEELGISFSYPSGWRLSVEEYNSLNTSNEGNTGISIVSTDYSAEIEGNSFTIKAGNIMGVSIGPKIDDGYDVFYAGDSCVTESVAEYRIDNCSDEGYFSKYVYWNNDETSYVFVIAGMSNDQAGVNELIEILINSIKFI